MMESAFIQIARLTGAHLIKDIFENGSLFKKYIHFFLKVSSVMKREEKKGSEALKVRENIVAQRQ